MQKSLNTPEHRALIAVLRRLREDAGLRQVDLAERLGKPQSFVSKYETGERRLDFVEVHHIALALSSNLAVVAQDFESYVDTTGGLAGELSRTCE